MSVIKRAPYRMKKIDKPTEKEKKVIALLERPETIEYFKGLSQEERIQFKDSVMKSLYSDSYTPDILKKPKFEDRTQPSDKRPWLLDKKLLSESVLNHPMIKAAPGDTLYISKSERDDLLRVYKTDSPDSTTTYSPEGTFETKRKPLKLTPKNKTDLTTYLGKFENSLEDEDLEAAKHFASKILALDPTKKTELDAQMDALKDEDKDEDSWFEKFKNLKKNLESSKFSGGHK